MASKTSELSTKELEELLDTVDLAMDRLKTLYESYFLGIQKQAPSFIHSDVERKLRDLQQMNMRNTGLRYRLATMQQKFGAYNSYWRRTLRQIENGTYIRNLAKIGREAARTGSEIPEEILAKMPKRMREQVVRDREAAVAIAKRRNQVDDEVTGEGPAPDFPPDVDDVAAMINEPSILRRELKTQAGAHVLAEDDGDMDFDSFFAAFDDGDNAKPAKPAAPRPDVASTQAITKPIPKTPPSGVPGMSLRTPAQPTTQPTTAMPRVAPAVDPAAPTTALPRIPSGPQPEGASGSMPRVPAPGTSTGSLPRVPAPGQPTSAIPRVPAPGATGSMPRVPAPGVPAIPRVPGSPPVAPSQASRPNPIAPGSSAQTGPTPVESMNGPFPRPDKPVTQAVPRATPPPRPGTPPPTRPPAPMRPPPGMTDADVNALHANYVKAKEAVGEKVDASSREKLLRTINQTAPKIMEQYKASGVDFTVVVKDNQVVIKAKPKG